MVFTLSCINLQKKWFTANHACNRPLAYHVTLSNSAPTVHSTHNEAAQWYGKTCALPTASRIVASSKGKEKKLICLFR